MTAWPARYGAWSRTFLTSRNPGHSHSSRESDDAIQPDDGLGPSCGPWVLGAGDSGRVAKERPAGLGRASVAWRCAAMCKERGPGPLSTGVSALPSRAVPRNAGQCLCSSVRVHHDMSSMHTYQVGRVGCKSRGGREEEEETK